MFSLFAKKNMDEQAAKEFWGWFAENEEWIINCITNHDATFIWAIDERLQPQYIAVKVVYSNNIRTEKDKETGEYVQVADQYISYIKQDITKIKGTFSTNQEVGLDKDAGTTEQSNRGLYIGLIVGSVVALSVVVIACAYSYVEQQEKKKLKK